MMAPSTGVALGLAFGSRSRGVDLRYWSRPDTDGRIPDMEAFGTLEPDHLQELTSQPAECAAFEDGLVGTAARRPGDFEPGVGQAGQARAFCWHSADADVFDLAELLAAT
jgi:hypothetical protein